MKELLKENAALLIILLFFIATYLVYGKFNELRIPEMDPSLVSFSKSVVFGSTINAASATAGERNFVIDIGSAEKEIDLAYDMGAGLTRFDVEQKTLASAEEIKKLDEVVSYARSKKMKIYLAYLGRDSWLGTGEGGGKANWEDFKKGYETDAVSLMERYKPDFFLILPDCPSGIGRQVDSQRTPEEWLDFAKETGVSIKQVSFPTKVVLEGMILSDKRKSGDAAFAERALENNDAAINIFSMKVGSATALKEGTEALLSMRKKYHWEGEIWMGNVENDSGGDVRKQKDFLLYALHSANSNGFSGVILGQLRDDAGNRSGVVAEDYSPKDSYAAIKEVMAGRK
ncbi:MAG: hypothetical protein WCQ96_04005 [Patescibacteria group bacterium]